MLPLDVVDDGLGPGRRELAADAEDVVRDRRRVDGRAARALEGRRVQEVLEPGRGLARVRAVVAERVAVLLQLADAVRELARELCRPRQQQPKEQASAEPRPLTARIQEILFEVREGVSLAAITSRTQETEERCLSALEELQLLGAIYVDGQGMYAAL